VYGVILREGSTITGHAVLTIQDGEVGDGGRGGGNSTSNPLPGAGEDGQNGLNLNIVILD
jgi:hypothetical protein